MTDSLLYCLAALALALAVGVSVWLERASRRRRLELRAELEQVLAATSPDAVEQRVVETQLGPERTSVVRST